MPISTLRLPIDTAQVLIDTLRVPIGTKPNHDQIDLFCVLGLSFGSFFHSKKWLCHKFSQKIRIDCQIAVFGHALSIFQKSSSASFVSKKKKRKKEKKEKKRQKRLRAFSEALPHFS